MSSFAMSITIPHPAMVELGAVLGCELVLFDNEQVIVDPSVLYAMNLAAQKHRLKSVVRLGDSDQARITSFLGMGVGGILLPNLRSVDDVARRAAHAKYPPEGDRSFGPNLGTRFRAEKGWDELSPALNRETSVHVLIETAELLDDVEEVSRLECVDQLNIGQLDLSAALGVPGDTGAPRVQAALDRVVEAATTAGKPTATAATTPAEARQLFDRGVSTVVLDPIGMVASAMSNFRAAAAPPLALEK